jgi:hypothetical protein
MDLFGELAMNDQATKETVLREIIAEAQTELAVIRDRESFLAQHISALQSKLHAAKVVHTNGKPARTPSKKRSRWKPGESLTDKIVEVLRSNNKPMRGTEIAQALTAQGVETGSASGLLPMVLSSLRKRLDIFDRLSRGVYKLKSKAD